MYKFRGRSYWGSINATKKGPGRVARHGFGKDKRRAEDHRVRTGRPK